MPPSAHLDRRTLLTLSIAAAGAALLPANSFAMSSDEIRPFKLNVPQSQLDDLRARLAVTRWPDEELVPDQSQGAQLAKVKSLVEHWKAGYDWRKVESKINRYPQFMTNVDGVDIHFLHIRSKHENAKPLIMTHGWPGSIVEMLKVIDPLTDPTAHGGTADEAFHLVVPSLPGFGFSGKPRETGWNRDRVARAWSTLMLRLGYRQYLAQGGDWGSVVTQSMGRQKVEGLVGLHVNMPAVVPKQLPQTPTPDEQAAIDALTQFGTKGSGYALIQFTRPQTIAYGLADSPVGQAAWIYEKFSQWTDSNGNPETVLTKDEMLDDIMFYWLTNSAASSARMYWENSDLDFGAVDISLPVAVSVFPKEIYPAPRSWAEKTYHDLVYFNRVAKGGHFAAFEQPELFTQEIRAAFRVMIVRG